MSKIRIAVYSIALNEEKHVRQWFESAKDADELVLVDTGSTDKTIEIAKSLGITVHQIKVDPWRFDVARNQSLDLVGQDIDACIQLDLDEVLTAGWRPKVEAAWQEGNVWPIYKHVTARFSDGRVRRFQNYFKIHPRYGFTWKYPIHEILQPEPGLQFDRKPIDLEVDHLQDPTKSRKSYLGLLEFAVAEMPDDWRMNHYLNREYYYEKNWVDVLRTAYEAMELKTGWDVERASTCLWASEAALKLGFKPLAIEWANRASEEAPHFYEAWHWRAHLAQLREDWAECHFCSSKILELKREQHHLVKPEVWEYAGFDELALSSYHLGLAGDAVKYGELAVQGAPQAARLKENLQFYREALLQQQRQ